MAADSSLGHNMLGMTWSLAVEEQFYLTLPLIVLFFSGRSLRRIVLSGIVLAPFLRLLLYLVWPANRMASFVLMPCRADALLLGVLAAILMRDTNWRKKIESDRIFFAAAIPVFLLGMAWAIWRSVPFDSPTMAILGYSWMAFFYFTILLFVITRPGNFSARALRVPWLRWLGSLAYGTYLLHQIILEQAFRFFGINPPIVKDIRSLAVTVGALFLTLLVAGISWTYFEKPLVKVGHRAEYQFENHDTVAGSNTPS